MNYGLNYNTELENPLNALNHSHQASKQGHNYLPLYWRYFRDIQFSTKKILEIGIHKGGSLKLWKDFFPNAEIHGFDIDENCKGFEEDRIKIFIGDQGKENDFKQFDEDYDIIIDDGSHIPEHMLKSLNYLYKRNLKHGGIYIIEDIEENQYQFLKSSIHKLIEEINYCTEGVEWPLLNSLLEDDESSWWAKNTLGVSFYKYICFVFKGRNPEDGEASARLNNSDEILLKSKRHGSKVLESVILARKNLNQQIIDSENFFSPSDNLPNLCNLDSRKENSSCVNIQSKLSKRLKRYINKLISF